MENQLSIPNLENLFDSQITTLEDRGTPEHIVKLLTKQRVQVISKAAEMIFEDGHIPFLPVIPRVYRSIYDLMSAVYHNDKVGYTHLVPTAIIDNIDTSNRPYYIFDVEDGRFTERNGAEDAEKILKSQKRSPLTVAEAIALTTHTDVLSRHNVWAAGSQHDSADRIPMIILEAGEPKLSWGSIMNSAAAFGSVPLGSRE